jgi:RES domain-containing protein
LCRAPYSGLDGEGARRRGGRWNSPGLPVVYAAEDAALSVLEVRVHLDLPPELLPDDYVLVRLGLAGLDYEDIGAWPDDPRAVGDDWLRSRRTPLLRAPSSIVAESRTVLLNPAHPEAREAVILSQRGFSFDTRLWRAA